MLPIKQMLVNKDRYDLKCPYPMTPQYITIHETDNKASALNEIKNMTKYENKTSTSFHFAVDDKEIIQGIPLERNAFHCGDGKSGAGNRKSIGIEICYNTHSNSNLYYQSIDNTIPLVVYLMKKYNIPLSKIVPHYHWSKKNCPSRMRKEKKWEIFIERVKLEMNKIEHIPSEWAKEGWSWAIAKKLFDGTNPQQSMTREMLATVLYRYDKANK